MLVLLACGDVLYADTPVVEYTRTTPDSDYFVLDVRSRARCEQMSLAGARCLPATDFFAPNRRLANFSGLLWLLGTAGLTGDEHVLLVGDTGPGKEFVAGLLYIMGQDRISVLITPYSGLKNLKTSPGEGRSNIREVIFQKPMRADSLVLRWELVKMLSDSRKVVIFDGRSENEYWGKELRTLRGGHIPGAELLPLSLYQSAVTRQSPVHIGRQTAVVAYGHDNYETLIVLARLLASGVKTTALLDGWVGWAEAGALPVDSVVYADLRQQGSPPKRIDKSKQSGVQPKNTLLLVVLGVLILLGVFMAGYFLHKLIAGRGE